MNGFKYTWIGFVLLFSNAVLSQRYVLKRLTKSDIICIDNDSISKCAIKGDTLFDVVTHIRRDEAFQDADTLKRDFIASKDTFFVIDWITGGSKLSPYTLNFQVNEIYCLKSGNVSFYVIWGFDAFLLGTNQNAIFILLRYEHGQLLPYSSYLYEDKNYLKGIGEIALDLKGDHLRLKHRNIKRLRQMALR